MQNCLLNFANSAKTLHALLPQCMTSDLCFSHCILLPLHMQMQDVDSLISGSKELSKKLQELHGEGGQHVLKELELSVNSMVNLACSLGCSSAKASPAKNASQSSSSQASDSPILAPQEQLLNADMDVEQRLQEAVAWLYKGSSTATEVASMLERMAHVVHQMQQRVRSLEEQLDWMRSLAGNTGMKENYAGRQ